MEKKMIGYKAFESDMTCRGKQYEENTVYEEPEAELCEKGMHFCENPFDVLDYYPLVNDDGELITTAEVSPLAEMKSDGKKSVTTKLRIGAKLSFGAFVKAGIEFLLDKMTNKTERNNDAQIGSSGNGAQIGSSGNWAKIGSSGDEAQISSNGQHCVIACTGHDCAVRAKAGSWITLSEWGRVDGVYKPVCVKTEYVDGNHIKADTFYWLRKGEFKEV